MFSKYKDESLENMELRLYNHKNNKAIYKDLSVEECKLILTIINNSSSKIKKDIEVQDKK